MSSVIIKPEFVDRFRSAYSHKRIIFFGAPCGCGKTTVAHELLRTKNADFRSAAEDGCTDAIGADAEAVVIDDLQMLTDENAQKAVSEMIRTCQEKKFILISRGALPGWLMPFELAGTMEIFNIRDFLLDAQSSRRMLETGGARVGSDTLRNICRDVNGYPVALAALSRLLASGAAYNTQLLTAVKTELFIYFDEFVFRRFDMQLRGLLLSVSPFERFTAEMAAAVSGDPQAGALLGRLKVDTNMLIYDDVNTYRFYMIFRDFLCWETEQMCTPDERSELFKRAGLYHELRGDIVSALDCYSKGGESHKVSELLEKHARLHPGVGHYYEMEGYYRALPKEEVLRSPSLMCGMSMLCALTMDFEQSEEWYKELRSFASGLKRTDTQNREVRGKLAYLDIALPQRGSDGLIDLIATVFKVMTDKQMVVPSFSVTSMLPSIMNGGKDFCEWSKKDDLLYVTMRHPVETVLGRDGVGLAECAVCESKFEKGENISDRLLSLVARLVDIQNKGTPDIEFAVVGLLARHQVMRGEAGEAREAIESLRARFVGNGQTRFIPNIDAMLCRIDLRLGKTEKADEWLSDKAPKDSLRLRAMWRYRYITLAMVYIERGTYDRALLVLAPLLSYCQTCGRIMDGIYTRLLIALCHYHMGNQEWKTELLSTLDTVYSYRFITPVASLGSAVLPMLGECGWDIDKAYFKKLIAATRVQAVYYPLHLKHAAELAEPLTATEMQVLRLLCSELSNQSIGDTLGIKLATVKTHVGHILQKLGVSRRSEAKAAAERLHLI